ncbi:amidohydrolase family protein [Streptacidiphilus neutrinimicus]|uniref:amidohydrolase family protein n=1 Tax=Streptacidiphilus neutrinimicus TaxID=105420 RepID=UPI0005A797B5|nr:amidohydrolase family protein [Streptacidiphilus neutrinimicus]
MAGRDFELIVGAAAQVHDATGHVVAPGFVDAHTHSDLSTLDGIGAAQEHAAVLQGVTVEICGNCGDSAFPGAAPRLRRLRPRPRGPGPGQPPDDPGRTRNRARVGGRP